MSDESELNNWLTTASPPEWMHPSIKIASQQELDAGVGYFKLSNYGVSELYTVLTIVCARLSVPSDVYTKAWTELRIAFATRARFYVGAYTDTWILVPDSITAIVEAIQRKYAPDHRDGES